MGIHRIFVHIFTTSTFVSYILKHDCTSNFHGDGSLGGMGTQFEIIYKRSQEEIAGMEKHIYARVHAADGTTTDYVKCTHVGFSPNDYSTDEALQCQFNDYLGSLNCVEFRMNGCGTLHVDLSQFSDFGYNIPLENGGVHEFEGPGHKKWCVG